MVTTQGSEVMKDKRSRQRYALSLSLVVLALAGWLCLPDRFPVSPRPSASAATSMTFTVTTSSDGGVLCPSGEPTCTLRFAINAANSNPGLDTIRFQITGSAPVKTINLESELPTITDPVIIDGTTQPGYAGTPLIELNGSSAGANVNGLTITAGSSTVKALVINRFSSDGIRLTTAGNNIVEGCYLGTSANGSVDLGNGLNGIRVLSNNNVVGGVTSAARNLISGNSGAGVVIGVAAANNQVQGNYIGTNADGTAALGNNTGVFISTTGGNNFVGGATAARNVVSGNAHEGIMIDMNTTTAEITNNFIGTAADGTSPLANGFSGVIISNASNNAIRSNTIAFNGRDGIQVDSGTGNLFISNRIFSNTELGIDLGNDGVTPNDIGDADSGPNNRQNFPTITSAERLGDGVTVNGTLNSLPNTNFDVQFFVSSDCDPTGNGEGRGVFGPTFTTPVTTDATGNAGFTVVGPPQIPGQFVTAVAMKGGSTGGNDTSEFSPCRRIFGLGSLQFVVAPHFVDESANDATVSIVRINGSDGATSVLLSTSDGTATAGQDYTDTDIRVDFADGQIIRIIPIPIINDNVPESSETINLTLSPAPGGAPVTSPSTAVVTINDDDTGSVIRLSNVSYTANEGCAPAVITVERIGDTTGVSTVTYLTQIGTASHRSDYTSAFGTLSFEPGATQKSIVVLINDDSLPEGLETLSIFLLQTTNANLSFPSSGTLSILDDSSEPPNNPNDDSAKFVCQHYHDFLNRQADSGGQNFWTNEIESCGTDGRCREVKRINVSAAFFLSIEFQQTGYLVYRMYKSAYGNRPGTPVPLMLSEFLPDTQAISQGVQVGIGDWQAQLEANKQSFTNEFAARARFTSGYPVSMTAAAFVDALNANIGGALSTSERNQLVNELAAGTKTRAQVLRAVAEDATLVESEFNRAFVLMQYFGYLRRDPDDAPDSDFGGYNFWLTKLNSFNGNFANAEMVKSFLVASEYRQRFGP